MVDAPQPSILDRIMGDPLEDRHYEAIGRFIIAYATAEAFAHVALRHYCGLSDELGRAIFAGGRISEISEKFRAVIRSHNDEKLHNEADALLTQFGLIANERGKIVHRETRYQEKIGIIVDNSQTSKGKGESIVYTLENLRNMTVDCRTIALRFRLMTASYEFDEDEFSFLFDPWFYKLPPPKSKRRKSRDKT